jgi:NADPH:quinone reductase-like Zn-dependent oxidoreductase
MKAVRIHEFGGPEVLRYEEVPRPATAPDEVLIKVYASGVNPVDWKMRAGLAQSLFPIHLPFIPGWDVSGEIEEVGSDILIFKKGEEVYGRPEVTRDGTYAEYVAVKADQINFKPQSIDHDKAASVPLAGLTAWQGLFDYGKLEEGQKVLIHAASGGVGSFAIQLAKWKGARVIGTASEENIDFLFDLGADGAIDYKNEKFEDKITGVDLVLDLVGGDTQKRSLKVIKKGGRLVTTVQPQYKEEAKAKGITMETFLTRSLPEELQQLANLIDSGKIKPIVTQKFSLKDAAAAQKEIEKGHTRGKIVLTVV